MSKQIKWKGTSTRMAMYMAINSVSGRYVTQKAEPSLTQDELTAVCAVLQALGEPNVTLFKQGAIGMQHRWCMTKQELRRTDANFKAQVGLIFSNRLAAAKADHMSVAQAMLLFTCNGLIADEIVGPFEAARQGCITEDEAIGLVLKRAI